MVAIWVLTENFKSKIDTKKFPNWDKRYPSSEPQGFKPFRIVVHKLFRSRDRAACFFCSGPYIIYTFYKQYLTVTVCESTTVIKT